MTILNENEIKTNLNWASLGILRGMPINKPGRVCYTPNWGNPLVPRFQHLCCTSHLKVLPGIHICLSHFIRHPSKAPFKNRFFCIIIDCECPALRIRVPFAKKSYPQSGHSQPMIMPKKRFLKGVFDGCLIK